MHIELLDPGDRQHSGLAKHVMNGFAVAIICGKAPKAQVATVLSRKADAQKYAAERAVSELWHRLNKKDRRPCRVELFEVDMIRTRTIDSRKVLAVLSGEKTAKLDFSNVNAS